MPTRTEQLISSLRLQSHPEGGYFAETYRSSGTFKAGSGAFPDGRNYSTSIYYLLENGDVSLFHRIRSDEIWHHYEGSSLTIHLLPENGIYEKKSVGIKLSHGEYPQLVVPAGVWFGVTVGQPDSYSLCGCTVSPGFDFDDFELARRDELLRKFPGNKAIIRRLTETS